MADPRLPATVDPFGPLGFLATRLHDVTIQGRCAEALELAESYEAIARIAGDERTTAFIAQARMYALLALGRLEEALAVGESLLRAHRAVGSRTGEAKTLADVAEVLIRLGRVDDGLHSLARALARMDLVPRGNARYYPIACSIAEAARAAELYELAEEYALIACEPFPEGSQERADSAMQRAEVMVEWALRLGHVGRFEEADRKFQQAVATVQWCVEGDAEVDQPVGVAAPLGAALLALGLARTGAVDEGARLAASLLGPMRQAGQYREAGLAHLAYGTSLWAAGDLPGARRELTAAAEMSAHSGHTIQALLFRHELAVLAAHEFPGGGAHAMLDVLKAHASRLWRLRLERKAMLTQARRRIQLEAEHDHANQAALQDPLTRIGNRRTFDAQIAALQGRLPIATTSSSLVLLVIDIDHFKQINDRYSHTVGDRILCEVATVLREQCRIDDVPVRLGGDEFAAFLRTGLAGAAGVAERIRRGLDSLDFTGVAPGLRVTVSMGMAELVDGMDGDELYATADKQLYRAKRQGRNQVMA